MIRENADEIADAIQKDLGRCKSETAVFDLDLLEADINEAIKNLHYWTKPEYVTKSLMYTVMSCYVHREPLGVALIIGAWNYPIQLVVLPLIGAIAAGNCAVLKPSEISKNSAELIANLIPKYLDNECFKVVCGGVDETTELLEQKFDKIFYTGNNTVGKIVMTAAAKHLTPVVLELGGKCPVYVADDADLKISANRLVWAKMLNCGQTCVAPDFILCSDKIQVSAFHAVLGTV
ncbi:aldehyde dehydrogenase family 3 member B2-like [Symsagittifera roscoffensis]|uniref:aldehyde dehydrogenase family 3 member B2-like n=1 Tax=Symsagittifera roscoffensis TaxID=84072 RepID=UPI00307B99E3